MNINRNELIIILKRLTLELELNCNEDIFIDKEDFYWEINSRELYNPYQKPELTLGQISEDWNELRRLQINNSVSLSYDLKRMSAILQLLEFKLGSDWMLQFNENIDKDNN